MPTPADPAAAKPRVRAECPRCGYDLSGVVESWKGEPPTTGICSECGLEVTWAKVLADPGPPRWFVEGGDRFSIWRAVATLFMLCRPVRFWKTVELSHKVRLWRTASVVIAVFAAMMLARWSIDALLNRMANSGWIAWSAGNGRVEIVDPSSPTLTTSAPFVVLMELPIDELGTLIAVLAAMPWAMVLLGLVISGSLREAKVRQRHVVRVALYNTAMVPVMILGVSAMGLIVVAVANVGGTRVLPTQFALASAALAYGWMFLWPLVLLVWWWAAYRHYMRLRRSFVGAVVMVTAALTTTIFVTVFVTIARVAMTGRWL